jgi:hypothetical protein
LKTLHVISCFPKNCFPSHNLYRYSSEFFYPLTINYMGLGDKEIVATALLHLVGLCRLNQVDP